MKKIIQVALKHWGLEQLSVFFGYLRASGWIKSLLSRAPVTVGGGPLPWYSYPCIYFLEKKIQQLSSDLTVFEYGSGNSTMWWAKKAKSVVSVEDNEQWFKTVSTVKPDNLVYYLADGEESYLDYLPSYPNTFQIIIVDGSYRDKCIELAMNALAKDGVLIVDNSDWESLREPIRKLLLCGFKELEFNGIGPCNGHPWSTSIFYRNGNFLRI